MYFKIKIALMLIFSINLFASDLEIEKIFKNKEVEGTIIIESLNQKKTYVHNKFRADTFLSPASSFKIPHTLIALNEGVVSEDSIITWDKVVSPVESCNNDQTLKSALKNSCIWCYQEFASKIESSKYKEYLKQMDYGNKVVGNDIKNFWVDESLKINAFEQIKFLKKLYKNDLPFKQKDIDTLKNIMIDEKNENYTLRAKTGWEGRYGWYVGYVETKNDVWFFAMNIDTKSKDDLPKRKAITLETLKLKGIIY
jgi:beta-lactamase class D